MISKERRQPDARKTWGIFIFELAYQLRRPWPWLTVVALLVFSFVNTRDAALADAMYEDFFVNAPFAVATTTVIATFMWLMIAPIVAGEAAARDVATRMHPLTFTTSVSETQYLAGRFLAALTINALILVAVQGGILAAIHSPGVNSQLIAPFRPAPYLTAYAIISLPNAFTATALQFAFATRSGRTMAGYFGSLLLFFTGFFIAALLLYYQDVGSLIDPVGMRFIVEDLAHEWTSAERNSRLIALEGKVLVNRLVWIGAGAAALLYTFLRFRFGHRAEPRRWWQRTLRATNALAQPTSNRGVDAQVKAPLPVVPRTFGSALAIRQTLGIAIDSFITMARSRVGFAVLVFLPVITVPVVLAQMGSGGIPLLPTTGLVLEQLTGPIASDPLVNQSVSRWVIIPLLLVFLAGELVWRERDAGLADMHDATPTAEWPRIIGTYLGLALTLVVLMALLGVGGVVAQLLLGHRDLEPGLYLLGLFGLQLPEYLLFALLVFVVHVVVNQKYVGHLVSIAMYAFIVRPSAFGIEHSLFVFSAGPWWSYSDMRGFGSSLGPWAWYKLYWAAWGMLLLVVARLLWSRGKEGSARSRIREGRKRLTVATTAGAAVLATGLVVALGGYVYKQVNVQNPQLENSGYTRLLAEYERLYKRYEAAPQPRMSSTRLRVDFHPARRIMEINGTYGLVNRSGVVIDSIHVAIIPGATNRSISFDREATAVLTDDVRGHRIYALAAPLKPGDSLQLNFELEVGERQNRGVDAAVVENGSFFTNEHWQPAIGYQQRRELMSASDRRAHGLAPRAVIARLDDSVAIMRAIERTAFDAIIGTDADQVAVAPGELIRSWVEQGRRFFHYRTSGPIGNDYAIFSARYGVRQAQWNDVAIRVFHHPGHTANLDRMISNIEASLEHYGKQFGSYRFRHLTFVEVRGNEIGMHADPSLVRYSEGTALWRPGSGPQSVDLPFAVVAHEMGHQWWGHTLEPAFVEGGPVVGEGVAEFAAMGVVESTKGVEQLMRYMAWMRRPFPFAPIRRGEPLMRGLDSYLSYRKAPFALHVLRHYIGADRVTEALSQLIQKHPPGSVPLVTTRHLYDQLEAVTPDTMRYLLHDLFEGNTFWEFSAERAVARRTGASTWQVTLDIRARKVVVDTAGSERPLPLDEWIEVGLFAKPEAGRGRLSAPLYLQRHRIRSGEQTITITLHREPALAGIDPHHILDWEQREDDDNIQDIVIEGQRTTSR